MNSTEDYNKIAESIIDEKKIYESLEKKHTDASEVKEVLAKASELKGLNFDDINTLAAISDPDLLHELFETAKKAKDTIYGQRLVIFAPLYISNLCKNECAYCAFRANNKSITRRALKQEEIALETKSLIDQGHKRVLLVAGESYPKDGFKYVLDSIKTVYETKSNGADIRRVNVNVAPLTSNEFKELKAAEIGTYQLFQETYHHDTYKNVHTGGKKSDYNWRISAINRAMEAGIDDLGIGVLFGLSDWRFEILAMMQHVNYLENRYGIGPHTLSVPRLEPASGSDISAQPPKPVSDIDFRKIVAILRLAVPYTGIIMSTRETPQMRTETFALGVSQISAGSKTNPGGYSEHEEPFDSSQFSLGDHRELDEVIQDISKLGYIPSFCTGCYRLGRTGKDFMDLAKPGLIKSHCEPNALSTFQEYLMDYASPETKEIGKVAIQNSIDSMNGETKTKAKSMIDKVQSGKKDIYC